MRSGACSCPGNSTGMILRPASSSDGALGFGSPGCGSGLFNGGTDSGAGVSMPVALACMSASRAIGDAGAAVDDGVVFFVLDVGRHDLGVRRQARTLRDVGVARRTITC